MPITCPHNDCLLQLLYGSDVNLLQSVIFKAAQSIELTHRCVHLLFVCLLAGCLQTNDCVDGRCTHVSAALMPLLPKSGDSMHKLRGKMLILLDQDETTRKALCATGPSDLFPSRRPVCSKKATGFFQGMHSEVLPRWVKDEAVTLEDFVDEARMLYLIA